MGYDISLVDTFGNPVRVDSHAEGGTYPIGGTTDASISITYNYAPFFRNALDEELGIRAKYNNRCFMCDKLQDENITKSGKQILLAVHHYDMNKDAGCNGNLWKFVPLCLHCHAISHTPTWTARIEYLLRCVWNSG